MKEITATEFRRKFRSILKELQGEEAIQVTKHGKPIAVLVSYDTYLTFKQMKLFPQQQEDAPLRVAYGNDSSDGWEAA
jgi:prevent-host-death family protein